MKIGVFKLRCGDSEIDFNEKMIEFAALKDITLEDHHIDKITGNQV